MQELDVAINSIRVRFGSQALTRAAELPPPQPWPSRTPIDRLSGIGGLPRGRLTVLTGNGTCGKLTLALALLAGATRELAHVIVIDPQSGFDPWTLLPFSPELGALTVVRAPAPDLAGEAAAALARALVGTPRGGGQPLGDSADGSARHAEPGIRPRLEPQRRFFPNGLDLGARAAGRASGFGALREKPCGASAGRNRAGGPLSPGRAIPVRPLGAHR